MSCHGSGWPVRCQRHLLWLLVQLWLKLCYGLEPGSVLGGANAVPKSGFLWSHRMRSRTIRERTRTVAVSHDHGHNHHGDLIPHKELTRTSPGPQPWPGPHLPACPAGLGGLIDALCLDRTGSVRQMRGQRASIILHWTVCACTIVAGLVCRRSGFAHASGVGWGR